MKKLYSCVSILLMSLGIHAQTGSLCTDPIIIETLPYSTADNTANYPDTYDPQTTTHPECSTTDYGNYYHGGNDVIYSYTPASSGTIKVEIPAAIGWTGMFIYTDCANIGVTYAACATGVGAGARTIDNFAVVGGQTYYIFISSWPAPQTVAYTLTVTSLTLGIDESVQAGIILYPNPAQEKIFVDTTATIERANAINVNGQKIEMEISQTNEIAIDKLQNGFYILELSTAEGITIHKNFVKSN